MYLIVGFFLSFMFISFFLMGLLSYSMGISMMFEFLIYGFNSFSIIMVFLVDWLSLIFSSFVFLISASVMIYSKGYMEGEINPLRFIGLVFMFVLSMIMMIMSPNLVSILLGWDGLGLVSYCLVIYYQNEKSYNAGMLTFLSNRLGDVALLISIVWMFNYGSWNFLYYLDLIKNDKLMNVVVWLVILASITKSAQIPFSSWLPAAMAAPTPVSSLVHSSTLVTAGVYLLIRFYGSFSYFMMVIFMFISVMTMFMSGLGANFEFDLKKIIALSTLSQLGLMMSVLFLGDNLLAYFHLIIHALFKAVLFMCAGYIIHLFMNCQDIRFMGGIMQYYPLTCSYFNICNLSLCGLPFMSGFYSKDLIVEMFSLNYLNVFIYIIYIISIGLTVSYSIRLCFYTMFSEIKFFSLITMVEELNYMIIGMSVLIIPVLLSGSLIMWLFLNPYFICLPLFMKIITLLFVFLGYLLGSFLFDFYYYYNSKSLGFIMLSSFLGSMWNMPILFTNGISFFVNSFSMLYYKLFDHGWFEYYGSSGLTKNIITILKFSQLLSSNYLKFYMVMILTWLFCLVNY
uniref:NADH-ubiquinone oxidoreductase chain 5 n=1 Tax=Rhadinosa nigrocyanea TaxID=2093842 RepID=A0A343UQA6_9CUCU|nr:NADH dehydrogenase subunit 5 [Rhadinosa nigrocyanea]AVF96881.1 NADH dehydrogenase subunit 5 [Rhadinosa nigrocyanea]